MKEDKDDFSGLTPVDTPLHTNDLRKMMMSFFVVPARLVKIKRLVDNLYRKGGDNV
jgi:hypothetical protein